MDFSVQQEPILWEWGAKCADIAMLQFACVCSSVYVYVLMCMFVLNSSVEQNQYHEKNKMN